MQAGHMTILIRAPLNEPARTRVSDGLERWLKWRADVPTAPDAMSIADVAECRCPDLCDRDHANE